MKTAAYCFFAAVSIVLAALWPTFGAVFTTGGGGSGGSATNALTSICTNGVQISGSVTQLDFIGPFVLSNSSGNIALRAPNVLTNGSAPTFSSATFTGPVNRITFTDTNSTPNYTEIKTDNDQSESWTNALGLKYLASGGTNAIDVGRYNNFMVTNNMATNYTLWLTNGAANKEFYINVLGPSNGNNYTLTFLSAQNWLMAWDRNCPTNGATSITVTNGQSVEFDGKYTKTPTNPIIKMVYSRGTL